LISSKFSKNRQLTLVLVFRDFCIVSQFPKYAFILTILTIGHEDSVGLSFCEVDISIDGVLTPKTAATRQKMRATARSLNNLH
jgi:hypothetical protein